MPIDHSLVPGEDLVRRLRSIRMLAMDIDGVMTDGTIHYDDRGTEVKVFHVADGLGIVMLRRNGVKIAWISGRSHAGVVRRAAELGIDHLLQGVSDKGAALRHLCESESIVTSEVGFIGDDWNDLPAFDIVGICLSVASAEPEVRERSDWVSPRAGGRGGVRDICNLVIRVRRSREDILADYIEYLRHNTTSPEDTGQ